MNIWQKNILGRGKSKCKDPEAGVYVKDTSNRGGQMAGAEEVRVRDDVREVGSSKGGDVLGTRLDRW